MLEDAEPFAIVVDVALFTVNDQRLELLLTRRPRPPFQGIWSLPGALVRPSETLESAAERALRDHAGFQGVYLEQLYTFGQPGRDPRGRWISVAYYALLRPEQIGAAATPGEREIRWVDPRDIREPLAFDHAQIIEYALSRLASKVEYTPLLFRLLTDAFTLGDLRRLWEAVIGRKLDPSNFSKRVLAQGVLAPVPGAIDRRTRRPARLYRYVGTLAVPGAPEEVPA